ncbi:MAG: O-antigen ligase family protein [Clostridia bacterium]
MNKTILQKKINIYEVFLALTLFIFSVFALEGSNESAKILIPYINANPTFLHLALTVLLCLFFLLIKIKRNDKIEFDIVCILLLFQCVLNLLPIIRPNFDATDFWGHYLNTLMSLIIYFIFYNSNIETKSVVKYFVIFGIVISIQVIWTALLIDIPFSDVVFKNYMRIPYSSSNMICTILVPIVFMVMRANIKSLWKLLIVFLLIVGIVLCHSRGGILILAVMTLIELITRIMRQKNKVLYCLVLCTIIIIGIGVFLFEPSVKRFLLGYIADKEFTLDGLTSGRLSIYIAQLKTVKQSPIFGTGLFYSADAPSGAHNLFIDLLAKCGIVGFIVYTLALYFVFRKTSKKMFKIYKYEIQPLYIFLISLFLYSMIEVCYFNYNSDLIFWMIAGILQSKKAFCRHESNMLEVNKLELATNNTN